MLKYKKIKGSGVENLQLSNLGKFVFFLNTYKCDYLKMCFLKNFFLHSGTILYFVSLLSKFENKNFLDIIYKYWEIIDFKEFS